MHAIIYVHIIYVHIICQVHIAHYGTCVIIPALLWLCAEKHITIVVMCREALTFEGMQGIYGRSFFGYVHGIHGGYVQGIHGGYVQGIHGRSFFVPEGNYNMLWNM